MADDAARRYRPIGDYAAIGDCRSAALVSRDGSIDWLCWPRFDSPSVFAALLDSEHGGYFRIHPTGAFEVERRYCPLTCVLETIFHAAKGSCVLRDSMTIADPARQWRGLAPDHELLRELEGLEGEVELEIVYAPRPGYARERALLEQRGALGIWTQHGAAALILRGDLPLGVARDGATAGAFHSVRAGECRHLALACDPEGPAVVPVLGEAAIQRTAQTIGWWREWAAACSYSGPYRDAVIRAALTLKLLAYAPSGAIVAAPTSSLPELPGGDANWDYRYCWLRGSAFTVRALYASGFHDEAHAFVRWMLRAVQLSWPRVEARYDVFGRGDIAERELAHLEGYAGSRPVRVGSSVQRQPALDIHGEIADVAWQFAEHGGRLDRDTLRLLKGIGDAIRAARQGFGQVGLASRDRARGDTRVNVLCWVALDRLIALHERHGLDIHGEVYRAERRALRAEIEERGYNLQLQSYASIYGTDEISADLLTLPLHGFIPGSHARMHTTLIHLYRRLGRGVLMHDDPDEAGRAPGPGALSIAGFWMAEAQARAGDLPGAVERFERLLSYANDAGLFAARIDPRHGAALGNFPLALAHAGLINAAVTFDQLQNPPTQAIDPRHLAEEDER
ncbi:MAG TPA: glycoside hydrolase family 15 protein [Thermomicrobiales bacterium]|nr:glycoside hydrolase family 15 protein [Thermomicrobiales bacterium]